MLRPTFDVIKALQKRKPIKTLRRLAEDENAWRDAAGKFASLLRSRVDHAIFSAAEQLAREFVSDRKVPMQSTPREG